MAKFPNINLETRIEEAEADGSKCMGCGDLIFLKAFRGIAVVSSTGKKVAESDHLICQGCGEAVQSGLDDPEIESCLGDIL